MFPRIFSFYSYIVIAVVILSFLTTAACRRIPVNSLSFDDVVYADGSEPEIWTLADGDTLSVPVIGVRAFSIADSMLVVSTNDNTGYVTVLDLDSLNVMGRFIKTGVDPVRFCHFPGLQVSVSRVKKAASVLHGEVVRVSCMTGMFRNH